MMRNPYLNGMLRTAARTLYQDSSFAAQSTTSRAARVRIERRLLAAMYLPAAFPALAGAIEAAAAAALLWPRFIDRQTTAFELALIEGGAGRLALRRVGHFHEGKPA